jgi:hypothetical protein
VALDRNGLEVIPRDECLELLRGSILGRVVVAMGALPAALPVTFGVLGEDIVFMAGTGTKLEAAVSKAVVAFEVDDIDPLARTGWSVLVTGWSSLVTRPDEVAAIHRLGLEPWVPGQRGHFVRIRSEVVSGRRVAMPAPSGVEGRQAASVQP